jgi:hypothetical protein
MLFRFCDFTSQWCSTSFDGCIFNDMHIRRGNTEGIDQLLCGLLLRWKHEEVLSNLIIEKGWLAELPGRLLDQRTVSTANRKTESIYSKYLAQALFKLLIINNIKRNCKKLTNLTKISNLNLFFESIRGWSSCVGGLVMLLMSFHHGGTTQKNNVRLFA